MPDQTYKEQYYRLVKAVKLADVLSASGITVADVMECARPNEFWHIACEGAEFQAGYLPSDETRTLTMQLLADREETGRRLLAMREQCQTK